MKSVQDKVVRIFTMPLQFPCGPQSACCGPIGQPEEEVQMLKVQIEKNLGVRVDVKNILSGKDMQDHRQISALFRTFGPMAVPVITIEDEVVSMGNPTPEEALEALRGKLNLKGGIQNANL